MASGALGRCKAIDDYGVAAYHPCLLVAQVTGHVCMAAGKGQGSAFVVVEGRRHPTFGVVAVAACGLLALRELPAVNIRVAILAARRRAFEHRFRLSKRN